jgi:hypothetical protein
MDIRMRRITRVALVGALSIGVLAGTAVPASAATGVVKVQEGTAVKRYVNPAPQCYTRPAAHDAQITNDTNSKLRLYRSANCTGQSESLNPHSFTIALLGSFYVVS